MKIQYSFIIPVKEINDYIRESVPKILQIRRDDYEIIIYPDQINKEKWSKTRQIASGPGGPAMKRSLSINHAKGNILIFIDDDSYPRENLLDILDRDFQDQDICAVGGPAITPPGDSYLQKVSGAAFLSSLSGGFPERYVPIGDKRFVDDWPSVNLSVRKNAFKQAGGFDSQYWPGEDTKFCLDLIKKTKKKILYDPQLIVYHHRREGLLRHLKQVGNYGLHRGFFAKKFPETSLRFKYFLPSAFLTFIIVGGFLSLYSPIILKIFLLGLIIYGLALIKALIDIRKYEKSFLIAFNSLYYIFFTHLSYGLKFMQGFLITGKLKSKLR